MMLLALDTSTRTIGIALYDSAGVISEMVWHSPNYHTMQLAPAVAEMLARSGKPVSALQALAVALGPGSFTGLRIGLALAKGLCLAHRLPLVGIPTLETLAAAQPVEAIPLAAVLYAGRGKLAVGWFNAYHGAWRAAGNIEVLSAEALSERIQSPTRVCGELNEAERRLLARKRKSVLLASPAQSLRRPSFLAELAWKRWQAGQADNPETLAPIYLHHGEPIAE
jgi:tRNA threonylcarbamoyladenosine biosynthesis protein TsaB